MTVKRVCKPLSLTQRDTAEMLLRLVLPLPHLTQKKDSARIYVINDVVYEAHVKHMI